MTEQIKTRIIHKHDLEVNWNKATSFIPKQGEIIIYDRDDNYSYERIKIGDGQSYVTSLPFTAKELIAGTNITLTLNSSKDSITINAKDTTYNNATTTSAGLMSATDKINLDNLVDEIGDKVDKISGKGLSTNDYTTNEKNKLAGIASGATKVSVDSTITSGSTNAVQSGAVYTALSNKVDKQTGKGLSTHDFDSSAKSKLDGIANGAEVNQNAFSNVIIGSTTVSAVSKTDNLTFTAGANITLTPDATNKKITIAATDTKLALDTNLNASGKAADSKAVGDRFTTVEDNLTDLSNDVTKLKKVIDITAEDPNNDTLDRISEIVTYTQNNKGLIDSITSSKQDKITGAASSVTSSNLTANRVLISNSNGKIAASAITSTELGYLDGVSSSVQQQLDDRLKTSELKVSVTGEGNAATAISYDSSTKTITLTKGATYNNYTLPSAGSSLGGVKTGGDVSITSGVITVNQASKVKNNLIIKLNDGSSENTNLFTFNGSAAKTINITPDKIGAMAIGVTIDGGTWS